MSPDIAPIAGIDREPFVIEVNPSVPVKTIPEFITRAIANPGKINMASGGTGHHLEQLTEDMVSGTNARSRRTAPPLA
jgi:tripartite-type tricarboxylate transporter receptor subunit TctC